MLAAAPLLLFPGLTGCFVHTHNVAQVRVETDLRTASLQELVDSINTRSFAVQSLSMTVDIAVSVGGAHKGKVTDYTSFTGYILLDRPKRLRVLGLLPVLHTKAFDMASNGDSFKLLVPAKGKAFEGPDKVSAPSANALENLRPYIFIQALLVAPIDQTEFSYLAGETTIQQNPHSHMLTEQADYDVGVLHRKGESNELLPGRIVHIDRKNLMPAKQDIYDAKGVIETEASYSEYKDFGGVTFPSIIKIRRPQEEYEMTLTVQKLMVNQKLNDNQFDLKFPEGIAVQKMQ